MKLQLILIQILLLSEYVCAEILKDFKILQVYNLDLPSYLANTFFEDSEYDALYVFTRIDISQWSFQVFDIWSGIQKRQTWANFGNELFGFQIEAISTAEGRTDGTINLMLLVQFNTYQGYKATWNPEVESLKSHFFEGKDTYDAYVAGDGLWMEVISVGRALYFRKYHFFGHTVAQKNITLTSGENIFSILENQSRNSVYIITQYTKNSELDVYAISPTGTLLNTSQFDSFRCNNNLQPITVQMLDADLIFLQCQSSFPQNLMTLQVFNISESKFIRQYNLYEANGRTVKLDAFQMIVYHDQQVIRIIDQSLNIVANYTFPASVKLLKVHVPKSPGYLFIYIAVTVGQPIVFNGIILASGFFALAIQYRTEVSWRTDVSSPGPTPSQTPLNDNITTSTSTTITLIILSALLIFGLAAGLVFFYQIRSKTRKKEFDALSAGTLATIVNHEKRLEESTMKSLVLRTARTWKQDSERQNVRVPSHSIFTMKTMVNPGPLKELSIPAFLMISCLSGNFHINHEIAKPNKAKLFHAKILNPDIIERAKSENVAAIKCFLKLGAEKDFLQEVALLSYFRNDRHFLQLLAYSHNDLALCTKYYPHGSLSGWIQSVRDGNPLGPPYIPETLRSFAEDIANGLDKMHAAGFVHSDVKPANILIDVCQLSDGTTKYSAVIADLGSTRIVDSQSLRVQAFTVVEKREATVAYAPPETVRRFYREDGSPVPSNAAVDWSMSIQEAESTDVFGYGMVLYEMLSTERPYSHIKNISEKAKAILSGSRPRFKDDRLGEIRNNAILSLLFAIMTDCCEHDPLSRLTMQQTLVRLKN